MAEVDRLDGIVLRPAERSEARLIERLVQVSSYGLARYVWVQMVPEEDPRTVGERLIARDEGVFSWRDFVLAELEGRVAGRPSAPRRAPGS